MTSVQTVISTLCVHKYLSLGFPVLAIMMPTSVYKARTLALRCEHSAEVLFYTYSMSKLITRFATFACSCASLYTVENSSSYSPKWVLHSKKSAAQKIVVKYLQIRGGDSASVGF